MSRNLQLIEKYNLENYPCFLPQADAVWLVDDHEEIPTEWKLTSLPFEDNLWSKFESNLKQVETKRPQDLFLEDLARAKTYWQLSLEDNSKLHVLPILIDALENQEAIHLDFRLPRDSKVHILLIEKNSSAKDHAEMANSTEETEKMRNISINIEVMEASEVEMTYIHPLYVSDDNNIYLKQDQAKVCMYNATLAKDASFRWTSINLGDSLYERGHVYLEGEGAYADVGGASYAQEGSKQSYVSHLHANKPHGKLMIHNHGVVESGGEGHFASIADIKKGSYQTKAREENRFMTLDINAKAYADPTLLIDEHDVEASHQATVGQIDQNQLYYLQSRGLSKEQASRLMTAAFLTPLFSRISIEEVKNSLIERFYEKMHVSEILGEEEEVHHG